MSHGRYIVIEGHDGTGKGTQANLLVEALVRQGLDARYVHEPGETDLGLSLEKLIKDASVGRTPLSNFLMFTINRIELWQQVIHPGLKSGQWIVADRSWISSAAYQGYAENLGIAFVEEETRRYMPDEYMKPDLLFGIHLDDNVRMQRIAARGGSASDTFESKDAIFQQRITQGYGNMFKDGAVRIDGDDTPEHIHARIWQHVKSLVP